MLNHIFQKKSEASKYVLKQRGSYEGGWLDLLLYEMRKLC